MIEKLKIHKDVREKPLAIADIDVAVLLKVFDKLNELIATVNEQEKKIDFIMEIKVDDKKLKELYNTNCLGYCHKAKDGESYTCGCPCCK